MYPNPESIIEKARISFLRGYFSKLVQEFFGRIKVIVLCFLALAASRSYSQCLKDISDSKPVTITSLGEQVSYPAINAFDNDDDAYGGWVISHDAEPGNECWISAYFNTGAEVIRGYSISALDDHSGTNGKAPSEWKLQASSDGVGCVVLDTRTGQTFLSPGATHLYSFSNSNAYSYYRIWISQTGLASSTQAAIGEIQLFSEVCITGTVFEDNGDRLPAFNLANDLPLSGIPVSIITSPAGNIFASTTTDAAGLYSFSSSEVPSSGSFSVIVSPLAGKIFVTHPANLWSSRVVLPSTDEEPPTGAVFFDYHLSATTNTLSAVNRMLFAGGNIDFGLMDADPAPVFACVGLPANLIIEADGGTFGSSSYSWTTAHPHQKGFTYSGNLYSSIAPACTDYSYNNTSSTSGLNRGVLIHEGRYTVMSF